MSLHRSLLLAATLIALGMLVVTCRQDFRPTAPGQHAPRLSADIGTAQAVLVGAGDIARCDKGTDEATAGILDTIPGTVFTTGDNIYVDGSSADYTNCYNPSWGRHIARTAPSAGDKDYVTPGATGYFGYFGAAAGDPTKGYYSYNLGSWHVVVLNSNIDMSAGGAQEQWLRADLAANPSQCTLAYWHHPRFYSGSGNPRASVLPLWNALYSAGAELILNGHTRNYERFAPQAPDGTADTTYGIREVIVGTGGIDRNSFGTVAANSEVRGATYGVLRLTLGSTGYAWTLISIGGMTLTDSGSAPCHAAPAPPPPPPPPPPSGVVLVGAGDIARCDKLTDEATAGILDTVAGTVFTAGDNIYVDGSSADYTNCYNPSWGRHKARTYPSAGDKDYITAGATGYFGYFGAAAGDPTKGYYSYNLGAWHVVVLNSNIATTAGSPQELWLKADLAASTAQCTVAYWHHPRFYSGSGNPRASVLPLWNDLYGAGADLVINGHTRNYERFAPQAPDGTTDPAYGIREIIAGTGGIDRSSFGTVAANSELRGQTYGVLKLTLDSTRYSWKLISISGQTLADTGSTPCHGAPPPVARPGGPYASEGVITFDGSASFDPQGDMPLTFAWDFGDGTTGSGVAPTHQYASFAVYTVTLIVTDSKGNASAPATTTATAQNFPPALDAGPDVRTHPSETVQLAMLLSDPGTDAPWSYAIAWGDGTTSNGSTSNKTVPLVVAHSYGTTGLDSVRVTLTDAGGASTSDSVAVYVEAPGTPQVFVGAGDIATCANTNDEATARLLDAVPGTVFTLGDNAYPMGALADYTNCYNPTWGRHRDRTHASLGNHEYAMKGAAGTYDYFGLRVGPRGLGYYSYDLGDWHIVVLNDNLSGSAAMTQLSWLTSDLAASTKQCTLAISHQPLFFSANSGAAAAPTANRQFWTRLYAAGAELFLNGHQHLYERFAPQTPDSVADPVSGIREFVVGTGGESSWTFGTMPAVNSEVRASTFGVLKLTLGPGSYSWQFIPIAGQTFADSGSGTCH